MNQNISLSIFTSVMILFGISLFSSTANAETYTYDNTGRLTGVAYDDGTAIAYTYDANGNILNRQITAPDSTPPVITLTGNTDVYVEAGSAYLDAGATASDNVDGNITTNISVGGLAAVDVYTVGTYSVTYNVTDAASNTAGKISRNVHVQDTTPPVITLNGSADLYSEAATAYADAGATANDIVDGAVLVAGVGTVNTAIPASYTLNYDYTDNAGNPAVQVTRTVHIQDTTPPVIILTGSADVYVQPSTSYTDAGASASDTLNGNITGSIVVGGLAAVDVYTVGVYVITYDVSDVAGNGAAQVSRNVHVLDTIAPVITLLGSSSVPLDQNAAYTDAGATASDNVDGDITANIVTGGTFVDTSTAGTFTITYNISDAASNAATQVTRTITISASSGGGGNNGDNGGDGAASSGGGGGGGGCIAPLWSNTQSFSFLSVFGLLLLGVKLVRKQKF